MLRRNLFRLPDLRGTRERRKETRKSFPTSILPPSSAVRCSGKRKKGGGLLLLLLLLLSGRETKANFFSPPPSPGYHRSRVSWVLLRSRHLLVTPAFPIEQGCVYLCSLLKRFSLHESLATWAERKRREEERKWKSVEGTRKGRREGGRSFDRSDKLREREEKESS